MEGVDKLFLPVLGAPLLSYALSALQAVPQIESIVLVLGDGNLERAKVLVDDRGFSKVHHVCIGGERRQDSVWRGLQLLSPFPWVVVQDGARPCLEPELVVRGLEEAARWGSAVAAVPMKDTVKVVNGKGAVQDTPDRRSLWAVQTPQIFSWDVLHEAYAQRDVTVTDDSALVERAGYPVHIYFGSYSNIKVTTREDSVIAEALLRRREGLTD